MLDPSNCEKCFGPLCVSGREIVCEKCGHIHVDHPALKVPDPNPPYQPAITMPQDYPATHIDRLNRLEKTVLDMQATVKELRDTVAEMQEAMTSPAGFESEAHGTSRTRKR